MNSKEIIYKINAAIFDCFSNGKDSLEIKFKENIDFNELDKTIRHFRSDKDVLSIGYDKNLQSKYIYGNHSTLPIGYSFAETSCAFTIELLID